MRHVKLIIFTVLGVFSPLLTCLSAEDSPLAKDLSLERCFRQKDLSLNLFDQGKPVGITKESCKLKVVFFGAQGSRWSFDLCDPQIKFIYQSPIDSELMEQIYSGSANCKKPLFGIDLALADNNINRFSRTRGDLSELLKRLRTKTGNDDNLNSTGGQLHCLERVLNSYLGDCEAFKQVPAE